MSVDYPRQEVLTLGWGEYILPPACVVSLILEFDGKRIPVTLDSDSGESLLNFLQGNF